MVVMETAYPATMPSGMWSSLLPSLPHWPPPRKPPVWSPCSQSRPADILRPNWSCGRPAALDVHVISPLQQQTIAEASHKPGHALQVGVHRKLASNLSACRSTGTDLSPLWPRPWAVLLRTLSTQFGPSAVPSPTGLVPLTLPSLRGIYLAGLLLPCGVAMPVCGCTAIKLCPRLWTG